ncbi:efflux RND transporter periplasmic adaptor subunit [Mesorhizobium composti]|uniref:Efflux RND transporter periplasmic adaptor subunit n=2 Tax=Hyphomicrobiales TaxID=356 RepID=A0ABY2QA80_9HYPH|nr:efflux RND transporter periplasmic adaptor subunit [Mesorhizobium composti]
MSARSSARRIRFTAAQDLRSRQPPDRGKAVVRRDEKVGYRRLALAVASRLAAGLVFMASAATSAPAESFDCVIDPAIVVKVGSQVPGLLDSVLINRGDKVTAGEAIATLSSKVESATVALMTVQAGSTSEIEAQKARLDLAQNKLLRIEELVKRNISAKSDLDAAIAEAEVVKRELALAEMRKRAAELELARAQAVLDQKTIRSPITGVVIQRSLSKGEYLDQDGQLATIAQLDPLFVESFLPVSKFGSIKLGMPAIVTPNEPITGTYEGTVKVVDSVFDAASSTFGVRVELSNAGQKLPAGHRCRVSFDGTTD